MPISAPSPCASTYPTPTGWWPAPSRSKETSASMWRLLTERTSTPCCCAVSSQRKKARNCAPSDLTIASATYCLWTLKEAFAKALGMGLSLPFDTIGFDLDPIRLRVGQHLYQHPAQWQFRLI